MGRAVRPRAAAAAVRVTGARPRRIALVAAALAIGSAATGCRGAGDRTSGCPSSDTAAVDPATMAFLSTARALHHEADLDEARGDRDAAIGSLERLTGSPAPRAPEVDEVLSDAYARLAELRIAARDLEAADRDVRAGLQRAQDPSYFRGHLVEVEGLVEEARAAALADAGRLDEADRARRGAIERMEEAVRIQRKVIERALGDGGRDG